MKITHSKYALKSIVTLCLCAIIIISSISYFGGWNFEWTTFGIFMSIIVGQILLALIIYFGLIRLHKHSYYSISESGISLYKKGQLIFSIKAGDIVDLGYARWRIWDPMVIGAGFLHFEYRGEVEKKMSITKLPFGSPSYHISMSLKQAEEAAKILGKELEIV